MIEGVIYKITNPVGQSYIGQTINWNRRYYRYSKLLCKRQPKIYNSLKKYEFKNHIFEILMENIPQVFLNDMEIEYIKIYDTFKNGLNLSEGGGINPMNNPESRNKLKRPISEKTRLSRLKINRGHLSEEHKKKISQALKRKNCLE